MPKIQFSIIVPVYNSSKYIDTCLNSIFLQNPNINFEVITIDDNSSDDSLNILKKYSERESRLRVLSNKKNKGPYRSRAIAANQAVGIYIMHVDIDDFLDENALNILNQKVSEYGPDVIVCNWKTNYKKKSKIMYDISSENYYTDKRKVLNYFLSMSASKIVKKELVEKNILKKSIIKFTADDLLYCTEILFNASNFLVIPDVLYTNTIHLNSFTNKNSRDIAAFLKGRVDLLSHLIEIKKNYGQNSIVFAPIIDKIFKQTITFILIKNISGDKNLLDFKSFSIKFLEFRFLSKTLNYISAIKNSNKSILYSIVFYIKNFGINEFLHVIKKILRDKLIFN